MVENNMFLDYVVLSITKLAIIVVRKVDGEMPYPDLGKKQEKYQH